ncbi:GNAT family N-acetyltransferase [Dermabacteraceae bacterium P7074]
MSVQAARYGLTKNQAERLWEMTCLADKEFVPPLSSRSGTVQKDLAACVKAGKPVAYYEEMLKQKFFFSMTDAGKIVGFMSYRNNYSPDDEIASGLYVSTVFVCPEYRGQGRVKELYRAVIAEAKYSHRSVLARTWSGNDAHTKVLVRFGFAEIKRIPDGRGDGIDTVYYQKETV